MKRRPGAKSAIARVGRSLRVCERASRLRRPNQEATHLLAQSASAVQLLQRARRKRPGAVGREGGRARGGHKVGRARVRGGRARTRRTVCGVCESAHARQCGCAGGGAKKKRGGKQAGYEGSAAAGCARVWGDVRRGKSDMCKNLRRPPTDYNKFEFLGPRADGATSPKGGGHARPRTLAAIYPPK